MLRMLVVACGLVVGFAALSEEQAVVALESIRNYRQVDERHTTAGQPNEEQLKAVAAAGFKSVINLATIDPRYSLEDEAAAAKSLGLTYYHVPVVWEKPTQADFEAFERAMQAAGDSKTLVHCAANFRATAFYALYAMKHLGWPEARAEEFRASVWKGSNLPVWEQFIRDTKADIKN
jgi:uncharacterized protein (TIGR01244 family)